MKDNIARVLAMPSLPLPLPLPVSLLWWRSAERALASIAALYSASENTGDDASAVPTSLSALPSTLLAPSKPSSSSVNSSKSLPLSVP